uniref:PB1-like domain-containing protein n=1 Tax=Cannabis sativa TaxID=3483 RepID=A0A803P347_CANSA
MQHFHGAHPNIFTVTIHHGGNWFTLSGNNKYEGGEVGHFDWVHFNYFTKKELDGMVIDLGYKLPVGFLYKPIGKTLNMGFMVVVDKDIKMIIEDIESNRATEIHVYLVFPKVVHALGWKEDSEVVNHVPSKALPPLKGCVIEELPDDYDVPVDVFGISIINIEEDHEEREVIMLCDSNHGTVDVGMEEANEVRNHDFEENLGEAEEVRMNKKGKRKVVEEDFILEEEEFIQDVEAEKEMGTKADPKRWSGSIADFCANTAGDGDSDGRRKETCKAQQVVELRHLNGDGGRQWWVDWLKGRTRV